MSLITWGGYESRCVDFLDMTRIASIAINSQLAHMKRILRGNLEVVNVGDLVLDDLANKS